MKYFVMSMSIVAVLAISVSAGPSVTLWEEDFESYADGTRIGSTAKWLNSPDEGLMIRGYNEESDLGQRVDSDGMALDGNSHKEQGVTGRKWSVSRAVGVPGPSAKAQTYTVSFNANVMYGSNSNGTANGGLYLECGDAACGEFGLHYSRANGQGWGFTGPSGMKRHDGASPWWWAGDVAASITLDKASMTATAQLANVEDKGYGDAVFATQAITQAVWDSITGFRVRNDIAGVAHHDNNFGIDVDNIVVSETVPEPATMGLALLALCGLAVIRRKR